MRLKPFTSLELKPHGLYSVQFRLSVVSDSLWPHGLQHARLSYHQLPELAQNHVHWIGDAIQPSHPLLSPSLLALNISQHQSFFQRVSSSHQVAKTLELQLQPFQLKGWFPLELTVLISLLSKGLSRVFCSTTVWKHPFLGTEPSLWPNSHIHTWSLEKP